MEIWQIVEEVYRLMRQQKMDMESLHRHGIDRHGHQRQRIGRMMLQNVDINVRQIIHGIHQQVHVMQIHSRRIVHDYHQMQSG